MVQDETGLNPRQVELIAVLLALGGEANYSQFYRAVRLSSVARQLKLLGKATFDKELDTLVQMGLIEKIEKTPGKRPIYRLSKKVAEITLTQDWMEQHIKGLNMLLEKLKARSFEGQVRPRLDLVFAIEKVILNTKLDELFLAATEGRDLNETLNEIVAYTKERFSQLAKLSIEDKLTLYKIISADTLRNFFLLEALIKQAYQSIK
jgi:DNA-binding HxlR family transcriptional regulator